MGGEPPNRSVSVLERASIYEFLNPFPERRLFANIGTLNVDLLDLTDGQLLRVSLPNHSENSSVPVIEIRAHQVIDALVSASSGEILYVREAVVDVAGCFTGRSGFSPDFFEDVKQFIDLVVFNVIAEAIDSLRELVVRHIPRYDILYQKSIPRPVARRPALRCFSPPSMGRGCIRDGTNRKYATEYRLRR